MQVDTLIDPIILASLLILERARAGPDRSISIDFEGDVRKTLLCVHLGSPSPGFSRPRRKSITSSIRAQTIVTYGGDIDIPCATQKYKDVFPLAIRVRARTIVLDRRQ